MSGFSDPLVDCRTCKQRFRADHLNDPEHEEIRCGKRPSKRPGETAGLRPDRAAPVQPDVPDARRRGRGDRRRRLSASGDGAGDLHQLQTACAQIARRKPPFGIAQVGKSFRNEITPERFIFRTLEFEQMEMEFFVPPGRGGRVVPLLGRRAAQRCAERRRPQATCVSPTRPTSSRTTRARRATSNTSTRWAGRSSRGSPTAARSTYASTHYGRRRGRSSRWVAPAAADAVRAARDPAGPRRQPLDACIYDRRLRRGDHR